MSIHAGATSRQVGWLSTGLISYLKYLSTSTSCVFHFCNTILLRGT